MFLRIKVHYIILLYVITYKKTNILYIKCSIVYILRIKPERIGKELRLYNEKNPSKSRGFLTIEPNYYRKDYINVINYLILPSTIRIFFTSNSPELSVSTQQKP